MSRLPATLLLAAALLSSTLLLAQPRDQTAPSTPPPGQLDPTRDIAHPQLFSSFHQDLPEQYIWTPAADAPATPSATEAQRSQPHDFRVHFQIETAPQAATLYLAGPRVADVWVNGSKAAHFDANPLSRLEVHVFVADVTPLLHSGANVLAVQAADGDRLVAKILAAPPGILDRALLISGPAWKASLQAPQSWTSADFDDSSWSAVDARGSIEGNIDFLQGNQDAGMYSWPGYDGESPFLAHIFLPAEKLLHVYAGPATFDNLDALTTSQENADREFTVHLPSDRPRDQFIPSITLDFGREVAGRVQVISDSGRPAVVSIAYGESLGEVDNQPYLGVDIVRLTPHGTSVGPKSAFRYATIRFLDGAPDLRFKSIRLEDIYYPVKYQGSFESSDPLLNRIWETGAYTSHLCMQNDIWDAPKRDRDRWMGDTDISGRVIDAVFADHFLVEDTLTRLIGPLPITRHVNGIPGYSSYWFTELRDYYLHTGRKQYISSMHDHIVQLLQFMDADFDAQNHFINHTHEWLYVDWSIDLNGDTPQSRETTVLEYIRAYRAGAWLLRQLGDTANADHFDQRAAVLARTAQASDFSGGSFGPRWQTNAMAVISGTANPDQYASIWQNVLSTVGQPTFRPNVITPYYGSYVLDALGRMHHHDAALNWIREYWGGMIDEGATSFWEAYDPNWPRRTPHLILQADDTAGYIVSLAHGWSSAPTYWLMQEVLGIQPTAPGFSQTTIRPDLVDLAWARGAEPTPHGLLKVDLKKDADHGLSASVDIPDGVVATVILPVSSGTDHILVNGQSKTGTVVLNQPGHYDLHAE